MDDLVTMDFRIDEINTILAGLGNMPYVQSAKLIEKIQYNYKQHLESKNENSEAHAGAA